MRRIVDKVINKNVGIDRVDEILIYRWWQKYWYINRYPEKKKCIEKNLYFFVEILQDVKTINITQLELT